MNLRNLFASALLLVASSAFAANPPAGTFDIDAAHSKVGFAIKHLVISTVEGRFKTFDGKIVIGDKLETSSVVANVDVNSIDTGVAKRDDHLKSPDFFNTGKKGFEKMTFKSTGITGTPEAFKMTGDLTMHGVTKKVTFDGNFGGAVVGMQKEERVAFTATSKINRKDFGLTWGKTVEAGPVVGDEVTITLQVEATKAAAAAAEASKTEAKPVKKEEKHK